MMPDAHRLLFGRRDQSAWNPANSVSYSGGTTHQATADAAPYRDGASHDIPLDLPRSSSERQSGSLAMPRAGRRRSAARSLSILPSAESPYASPWLNATILEPAFVRNPNTGPHPRE